MVKQEDKNLVSSNRPIAKKVKPKSSKNDLGFDRFMQVIDTKDLVAMVLKSHLLVEYYIDQLIILCIPRGDIITDSNLNFYNKLKIVRALDILLDRDLVAIEGLNSLRNACSHVLNYKIGENDIDKIGKPYGAEYLDEKYKYLPDIEELLHFSLMRIVAHLDAKTESILSNHKEKLREHKKYHMKNTAVQKGAKPH